MTLVLAVAARLPAARYLAVCACPIPALARRILSCSPDHKKANKLSHLHLHLRLPSKTQIPFTPTNSAASFLLPSLEKFEEEKKNITHLGQQSLSSVIPPQYFKLDFYHKQCLQALVLST